MAHLGVRKKYKVRHIYMWDQLQFSVSYTNVYYICMYCMVCPVYQFLHSSYAVISLAIVFRHATFKKTEFSELNARKKSGKISLLGGKQNFVSKKCWLHLLTHINQHNYIGYFFKVSIDARTLLIRRGTSKAPAMVRSTNWAMRAGKFTPMAAGNVGSVAASAKSLARIKC